MQVELSCCAPGKKEENEYTPAGACEHKAAYFFGGCLLGCNVPGRTSISKHTGKADKKSIKI
jgi:hypothetical protein